MAPLILSLVAVVLFGWRSRSNGGRDTWSADGFAVSGLIASMLALHWQIWTLPDVTAPKGGGDLVSFLFPTYQFAARSIAEGYFPFWNPTLFAGAPFAADLQSGIFYPPNLLAFLIARPFTYEHLVTLALLHYPIAAIGGYCLGRSAGMDRLSAFASGAVFGGSGFMVAHFGHYNMLASAAWVPWLFATYARGYRLASLRWFCVSGAFFALIILPGHIQTALYTVLAIAALWLAAIMFDRARVISGSVRTLSGAIVLGSGALGAAVLLVPAFELTRLSIRSDITYGQSLEFTASPLGWITFVIPHFFGDSPSDYWGLRWSLQESYGYVGIASLVLGGLAVLLGRRNWLIIGLMLGCLFALCISIGESTALQGWLYRFVPGFDKVRAPGRALLFVDLTLSLLVGIAVIHLRSGPSWRGKRLIRRYVRVAAGTALIGAVFVVPLFYYALMTNQDKAPVIVQRLGMAIDSLQLTLLLLVTAVVLLWHWSRGRVRCVAPLMVSLLVFDLIAANGRFNPTTEDILAGFRHDDIIAYLRERAGNDRIDTRTGISDTWQPNLAAVVPLNDVTGLFNPLMLRSFDRYWEGLGSRGVPGYDLFAARMLVAKADAPLDATRFRKVAEGQGGLAIFENSKALPRAFVAPTAEQLNEDSITARLRDPGFDPRAVVLMSTAPTGSNGAGTVDSMRFVGPNEIRLLLRDVRGGYLVISNVDYPGWRATVDGTNAGIATSFNLFQSIALPDGATEVRLTFRPRNFVPALIASGLTWCLFIACGVSLLVRPAGSADPRRFA